MSGKIPNNDDMSHPVDRLHKIADMRLKGLLSDEEFAQLKKYIMEEIETQKQESANPYETYENASYGIKLKYPSEWEGKEYNSTFENITHIVDFCLPVQERSRLIDYGQYLAVFMVHRTKLYSKNMRLQTYVSWVKSFLRKTLKDMNVEESSEITICNIPSHKMVVTFTDQIKMTNLRVLVVTKEEAITLTFQTRFDLFDELQVIANKMIQSFELTRDLEPPIPLESHEITYDNPGLGIRMRYPDSWVSELRSSNGRGPLDVIVLLSPADNDENLLEDRVTIEVRNETFQEDGALDNYVHKYIENLVKDAQKSQITLIESIPLTVADSMAKRITYRIIDTMGSRRISLLYVVTSTKIYCITYGDEDKIYDKRALNFQRIIDSLELAS